MGHIALWRVTIRPPMRRAKGLRGNLTVTHVAMRSYGRATAPQHPSRRVLSGVPPAAGHPSVITPVRRAKLVAVHSPARARKKYIPERSGPGKGPQLS